MSGEHNISLATFKEKIKAWWEGTDANSPNLKTVLKEKETGAAKIVVPAEVLSHKAKDEKELKRIAAQELKKAALTRKPLWTPNRLEIQQKLWGLGFISPGNMDYLATFIKPFGLTPSSTVLDLAAGTGALARFIVDEYGAWVQGYEDSEYLAAYAQAESKRLGFERQARIDYMNIENLKFDKEYDCIFAKDKFFTILDKFTLYDKLEETLKSKGQLMFTDFVLGPPDTYDQDAIMLWKQKEPVRPYISLLDSVIHELVQRNFDIRTTQDITADYIKITRSALAKFIQENGKIQMDIETKKLFMDEVELWVNRVEAWNKGLKVYKFFAIKRF